MMVILTWEHTRILVFLIHEEKFKLLSFYTFKNLGKWAIYFIFL